MRGLLAASITGLLAALPAGGAASAPAGPAPVLEQLPRNPPLPPPRPAEKSAPR